MKNVLLIGAGRFGRHIAMQLSQLGHQVMAVDTNEERINDVLPFVTNAQIGVIPNVSPTVPTADAASYRQEDSGRFSYTLIKTPPPKNRARYIVRMVAAVLTAPQSTLRPKSWALSRWRKARWD